MDFDIILCTIDSANWNLLYRLANTDTLPLLGYYTVYHNLVHEDSPILHPPMKRGNTKPGYFGEINRVPLGNTTFRMMVYIYTDITHL